MRTSTIRLAAAVALSTGVVASLTSPTEAAPVRIRGSLMLTSFVQNGLTNVNRNQALTFKFTVKLNARTVDNRSLRINALTGTGSKPAIGARIVKANIVTFDPTRTQRNYDGSRQQNSTQIEKDNAIGFSAFQDYSVEIPVGIDQHILFGAVGQPFSRYFQGGFRTTSIYNDPVPGQPFYIGDHGSGLLGFDPPRSGATGLVDADAVIIFEFNEPMDISTLDPSTNVIVTRVAVGERVPGYVIHDPNEPTGRRFLFIPSVGFGSDAVNLQGWDIGVTLTTGITDLAGIPLKRPMTFPVFRTRYVANAPSCSMITESFDNNTLMDPTTPGLGGEWNTLEKGALRGGAATSYLPVDVAYGPTVGVNGVTVAGPPGIIRVAGGFQEPLVGATIPSGNAGGGCTTHTNGARLQQIYVPTDIGIAAAVVGIGWGPSSNALFAGNYPLLKIDMGHSSQQSLTADFASNIDTGAPVTTYLGTYTVPQVKNIGAATDFPQDAQGVTNNPYAKSYYDYPVLATPFEWNGASQMVVDWQAQGGDNCQIMRAAFVPGGIAFPARRAYGLDYQGTTAAFTPDAIIYDTRFRKRRRKTYAVSTWYQVASDSPIFATPIVNPSGQPGGVTVLLEVEGAHGKPDPFNVGKFIADPTTGTGFTTVASQIDGHRFFRFRFTMTANLTTNQTARVTSVQFPYCFN
jgi:hypothetical protein